MKEVTNESLNTRNETNRPINHMKEVTKNRLNKTIKLKE